MVSVAERPVTMADSRIHQTISLMGLPTTFPSDQSPEQMEVRITTSICSPGAPFTRHREHHFRCGFVLWRLSDAGPGASGTISMGRHPKPYTNSEIQSKQSHVRSIAETRRGNGQGLVRLRAGSRHCTTLPAAPKSVAHFARSKMVVAIPPADACGSVKRSSSPMMTKERLLFLPSQFGNVARSI